jgi:hypothetical protein
MNKAENRFYREASPAEPIATIHVDGSFVHVQWHATAPNVCHMPVFASPKPPALADMLEACRLARDVIEEDRAVLIDSNQDSAGRLVDEDVRANLARYDAALAAIDKATGVFELNKE